MVLSRNRQALNHFVAAATLATWGSERNGFVSARVRGGTREAPVQRGYDPTAPLETLDAEFQFLYHIPESESIEKTLKIVLENTPDALEPQIIHRNTTSTTTILQNSTISSTSSSTPTTVSATISNATQRHDLVAQLDLGIFESIPSTASKSSSKCMIGFQKGELHPADEYLRREIETGRFAYAQIVFDEASNTVFCNQNNDVDDKIGNAHHTYGCASMHFQGCSTVKCNGKESCIDTIIEDAITIECEGYESCRDAKLDASTVDCGGEAACMGATIGANSYVSTLDCHSGESACAYASAESVGSVFCTGPLSCYGAAFSGVRRSVTCQGVPHPHNYYMPTCGGGKSGSIEAEDGYNIDVICDGDFACIGPGDNDKDLPSYFGIDVGDEGTLTCGGSLVGNRDGFTFVCKYLDLEQHCSNYQCKEPSFALADHAIKGMTIDSQELKTCNHVFSLDQHKMCTGEKYEEEDDDDDEDEDEEDEDSDEEEEEEEDDEKSSL